MRRQRNSNRVITVGFNPPPLRTSRQTGLLAPTHPPAHLQAPLSKYYNIAIINVCGNRSPLPLAKSTLRTKDTSEFGAEDFRTFQHHCRSVLGPNCLGSEVSRNLETCIMVYKQVLILCLRHLPHISNLCWAWQLLTFLGALNVTDMKHM